MAWFPTARVSGADAELARYFEELRGRRLYRLANGYAAARLTAERLAPEQREELQWQQLRTLGEHARSLPVAEGEGLWQGALTLVERLRSESAVSLRTETEIARLFTGRGVHLARSWELTGDNEPLRVEAVKLLRGAAARCESVLAKLREPAEKPAPELKPGGRASAGDISPAVRRQMQLELSEARIAVAESQAALLARTSPDRAAELVRAEELAVEMSDASLPAEWRWRGNWAKARVHRLRGDFEKALRLLQGLEGLGVPAEYQPLLSLERGLTLADQRKLLEAAQLVRAIGPVVEHKTPAWVRGESVLGTLKILTLVSDLHQRSKRDAEANETERQMLALVESQGPYLSGPDEQMAREILETAREIRRWGPALFPLVRQGAAEFRAGNTTAAAATLFRAVETAREQEQHDRACDLGFTWVSVLVEARQWTAAREACATLLTLYPAHPKASDVGLLACHAASKEWEATPSDEAFDRARKLLREHRIRHGSHPSSDEAWYREGVLCERNELLEAGLTAYLGVAESHTRYAEAVAGLGRLLVREAELAVTKPSRPVEGSGKPPQPLDIPLVDATVRLRAKSRFEKYVAMLPQLERGWTATEAELAWLAGRWALAQPRPDYRQADRWLEQAQAWGAAVDRVRDDERLIARKQALQGAAQRTRLLSLAGRGEFRTAREWLDKLSSDPRQLLQLVAALSDLPVDAGTASNRELAELRLAAAESLHTRRGELSTAEIWQLDVALAESYLQTNQSQRAFQQLQRMAKQAEGDGASLQRIAGLVAKCTAAESAELGLSLWRGIEKQHKAGSTDWLEARFQICDTLARAGRRDEGLKLLRVTRLLYPKLGNPETAARFESLEQRLKK